MFECTEFQIESTSDKIIYNIIVGYFIPTRKYICDLFIKNDLLMQCCISNKHDPYFSYSKDIDLRKPANLFFTCLNDLGFPTKPTYKVNYRVLSKHLYPLLELLFSSQNHIFKMTIKEEKYYYYIRVGGKLFDGCLELFLHKGDEVGSLSQVYAEPECGYDAFYKEVNLLI